MKTWHHLGGELKLFKVYVYLVALFCVTTGGSAHLAP